MNSDKDIQDLPDLEIEEDSDCDDGDDGDDSGGDWTEEQDNIIGITCLFCDNILPGVDQGFIHCKDVHNFDINKIKSKYNMDQYSYIKMITYIRSKKPKASELAALSNKDPPWKDDVYLKPVRQEDWLTYDMCPSDDEDAEQKPGSARPAFHANVEDGLVTLSEAHFGDLQRTIQSLSNQLKESHNLLAMAKEDMETMKTSFKQIVGEDNNTPSSSNSRISGKDEGYFGSYAHFGIHHDMLTDRVRTESYRSAILDNSEVFRDKVILDVGCGTGILSMFSASASASSVIAVDMSDIVYHAMDIVRENGLHDKIKILKGRVEDVPIPGPVDVIVSEWMGYFLLFEGMLDSVIYARDRHMKPGGLILPNRCNISIVGSGDVEMHAKFIDFWSDVYGYKMNCMKTEVIKEASIDLAKPDYLITEPVIVCDIDMYTCTVDSVNFSKTFDLKCTKDGMLSFLVGYFDTFFDLPSPVSFSTGPSCKSTHWKQTIFYLKESIPVKEGQVLECHLICSRSLNECRDLIVHIKICGKLHKYIIS